MRLFHRVLCGMLVFVGCVSALGQTSSYTIINSTAQSWTAQLDLWQGASCGVGAHGTLSHNFGAGASFTFSYSAAYTNVQVTMSLNVSPFTLCSAQCRGNVAGQTDTFTGCGSLGAGTNCYVWVHVIWTNCAVGHWAQGQGFWIKPDGTVYQDPFNSLHAVAPGGIADFYATNTCDFTGGEYAFGDGRGENDSCPTITLPPNQVTTSPVAPGTNDSPIVITPIGGPPGGGGGQGSGNGSTNGATGKDITTQTAALLAALANLANDVQSVGLDVLAGNAYLAQIDSLMMNVTNILGQEKAIESQLLGTNAAAVSVLVAGTNLTALGNTLLSQITNNEASALSVATAATNFLSAGNTLAEAETNLLGRIFTNLLTALTNGFGSGTNQGTNVFVMNMPTNLLSQIVTNTAGMWTELSNLDLISLSSSNELWFRTNAYEQQYASNEVAGMEHTNVENFFGYSNDLFNAVSGATNGFGELDIGGGLASGISGVNGMGVSPDSGFGLLALGDGTSVDLKQMLNGAVIESPFAGYASAYSVHWGGLAGIRSAIRLLIMWAIVIGMVLMYSHEIRRAMLEVLHVPAIPVADRNLLGDAAKYVPLLGPASSVASTAAVRIGLMIMLTSMLVFVPSILVAGAATVYALLPASVNDFVGAGGINILTSLYPAFGMVYNLINSWLPLYESFIFSLNYVVAIMGVNSVVCFLGTWKAGYGA